MRVHANFAEYVPFALLLATFVETGSYVCFALRLWPDASSMPTVFLRCTRILGYGWPAWGRHLLSLSAVAPYASDWTVVAMTH